MVREFNELNTLEKLGFISLLEMDGWKFCRLGDEDAYTLKMGSKKITIKKEHFWVDEED